MHYKKYIIGFLCFFCVSTTSIQPMEEGHGTLETIPVELKHMIIFYLSWSDLVHMSLTCNKWKKTVVDPVIFERIGEGSSYNFLKQYAEKLYELNQKSRNTPKQNFTTRNLNKKMRSLVKKNTIDLLDKKIALLNLFVQGCFLSRG